MFSDPLLIPVMPHLALALCDTTSSSFVNSSVQFFGVPFFSLSCISLVLASAAAKSKSSIQVVFLTEGLEGAGENWAWRNQLEVTGLGSFNSSQLRSPWLGINETEFTSAPQPNGRSSRPEGLR